MNELIDLLKTSIGDWNRLRRNQPEVTIDLSDVNQHGANLPWANLSDANHARLGPPKPDYLEVPMVRHFLVKLTTPTRVEIIEDYTPLETRRLLLSLLPE